MTRIVPALSAAALALALAGCSSADADDAATASTPEATATVVAQESPSPSASPSPEDIVAQVAADHPLEDWAPADSPALALTAAERQEYMEIATASLDLESAYADLITAEDFDPTTMTDILTDVAAGLPRAGRDIMVVSMLGDSAAEEDIVLSDGDLALMLESGWGVCEAVSTGVDYGEAFAEAFAGALTDAMAAGLVGDEAEAEAAANTAAAAMMGTMFAHLQCPEHAAEAVDALAQMGNG